MSVDVRDENRRRLNRGIINGLVLTALLLTALVAGCVEMIS